MTDYIDFKDENGNEWTRTNRFRDAKETIAAQAVVIEKLRGILTDLYSEFERTREWGCLPMAMLRAKAVLAIPTDSTQILDEVRRAERERQLAEIPLDDIKQALTKYSEMLVHVDCGPVYRKHLVAILDKAQAAIRVME